MTTRRPTKACARCRKRKKKCDFVFPVCGSCALVNANCYGYDAAGDREQPRSSIAHLENKVAELEIELSRLKDASGNDHPDRAIAGLEKLALELASTVAEPSGSNFGWTGRDEDSSNFGSLNSHIYLSPSPIPRLNGRLSPPFHLEAPAHSSHDFRASNIASIPRHVINIMLTNYCEIYLTQYPAVEESELYKSCDRIYLGQQPSHFDYFSVALVLAISANTLIQHDESRALAAAGEFWATALEHLDHVGRHNQWQRLQALQLLTHYGLLNPEVVNCSSCAHAATRLCIELGLHREFPWDEQQIWTEGFLDRRRRLFWTSFRMDAAIHFTLRRPYQWSQVAATAKFPKAGPDSAIAAGSWQLRQMEMEVTMKMYYPGIGRDGEETNEIPFADWFVMMHRRLEELNNRVGNGQVNNIDLQLFRLNRPSPRCPNPTREMREKAIRTAIALIKEYASMGRSGKLFYIWYAAHYLVELGASLLHSIISGLEDTSEQPTHLVNFDIAILGRTVRTFPQLLNKVASHWPAIIQQASILEDIATSVFNCLEQLSKNEINSAQFDFSLPKEKLSNFLLFSHAPNIQQRSQNTMQENIISPSNNFSVLFPASNFRGDGMDFIAASNQLPLPSLSITATEATDLNPISHNTEQIQPLFPHPDWLLPSLDQLEPSLSIDQYYTPYADPRMLNANGMAGEQEMLWHLAGLDSDQIFAALLEGGAGGTLPLLDEQ